MWKKETQTTQKQFFQNLGRALFRYFACSCEYSLSKHLIFAGVILDKQRTNFLEILSVTYIGLGKSTQGVFCPEQFFLRQQLHELEKVGFFKCFWRFLTVSLSKKLCEIWWFLWLYFRSWTTIGRKLTEILRWFIENDPCEN